MPAETGFPSNAIPIVLSAFGTTVAEARQTYDRFEEAARRRFPNHPIRWAFTSSIVRRTLEADGIHVMSPQETLEDLHQQGESRAVVQSLHVTPGEEYTRLCETQVDGMSVVFGKPLLSSPGDQEKLLSILASEVRTDVPTVFVGHGNEKKLEFNATNLALAKRVEERFPGAVLASIEGTPGPMALEKIRDEARRVGAVHFIPLLFVAGDHVRNDLLGHEPGSWKNQLGVDAVTCSPSLGNYPAVVEMYLDHLAEAVGQFS